MEWACSACTYINTKHQPTCEICSTIRPPPPSSSLNPDDDPPQWSCLACTFLNPINNPSCEMCGASMPHQSAHDPPRNSTFWPLRRQQPLPDTQAEMTHDPDVTPAQVGVHVARGVLSGLPFGARKRKARDEVSDGEEEDSEAEDSKGVMEGKSQECQGSLESQVMNANAFLGELHLERLARQSGASSASGANVSASKNFLADPSSTPDIVSCKSDHQPIVIMTYNVWFQDLEVDKRMAAIGDIVQEHNPDIICFQEVTPDIYGIFQRSSWWSEYKCSVPPELAVKRAYFCLQLSKLPVAAFCRNPFRNSIMGRELCLAKLEIRNKLQLVVATSHLESPCPAPPTWNQMFSEERVAQANESMNLLKSFSNVIFGGDMNWDDKLDGPPPLLDGWFDVWLKLHPDQMQRKCSILIRRCHSSALGCSDTVTTLSCMCDTCMGYKVRNLDHFATTNDPRSSFRAWLPKPGLTYDGKANPMLAGNRLRKRLDRIYCHLPEFDIESIEIIGQKAIPNLTYTKEKKVKKQNQVMTLPVLPSDHFGLLLKITVKC